MKPRQTRRNFAHDMFKCVFLNEYVLISTKIILIFIPKSPINIIPALDKLMAGSKTLSEPMMFILLEHICVARPQLVNYDLGKDK